MKFTKKSISILIAALALFVFTVWGYPQLSQYLQVEICKEDGGTWIEETATCE